MNVKNFPAKLGYAFFSVALVTLIYGFTNSTYTQKNEYMSITIEHKVKFSASYQLISIIKKDTIINGFAIMPIETTPAQKRDTKRLRRRLKEGGFEIINKNAKSVHATPFEFIQKYEAEGWTLKSHSIGLGLTDGAADGRISQYLMSRKAN